MGEIPSPYNFVPLSDKVFLPEWADKISHDVPFSDGISGKLDIALTTKKPMYIRNSGNFKPEEKEDPNSKYNDFFQFHDGVYRAPATSIKGLVRNTMKIVSFGKMNRSEKNDERYSIRDLQNERYRKPFAKVKAGIVRLKRSKQDDDIWELYPYEYARIRQTDLEKYAKEKAAITINLGEKQTAKDKYNQWQQTKLGNIFNFSITTVDNKKNAQIHEKSSGTEEGILVFTGQPVPRDASKTNKRKEFVFYPDRFRSPVPLAKKVIENFKRIHSVNNGKKKEDNPEWEYWRAKLESKKTEENDPYMPVFYIEENGKIDSMGLAMMYRLPCYYTVRDAISNISVEHLSDKIDLTEGIFGFTSDNNSKLTELKGRVQFSHLKCETQVTPLKTVETVLSGPKATYYPNYLLQPKRNKDTHTINKKEYHTFMDEDVKIRGWKKYLVHPDNSNPIRNAQQENKSEKVKTFFRPLPGNTRFTGSIYFHNLRPQELGALIWTLTFGGEKELCHNMGMGKPYGFGSVQIAIVGNECVDIGGKSLAIEDISEAFVKMMNEFVPNWLDSEQMYALKKMANPKSENSFELRYPTLDPEKNKNEFVDFKGKGGVSKVLYHIEKK